MLLVTLAGFLGLKVVGLWGCGQFCCLKGLVLGNLLLWVYLGGAAGKVACLSLPELNRILPLGLV